MAGRAVISCLAALALGLSPDEYGERIPRTQFSTRVEAVRVDVLVTNRGRLVEGLTAEDFQLRDEGVLQRIDVVDQQVEPLNVICLVDTADTLRTSSQFYDLINAGAGLVDRLQPRDRIALIAFSNRIRILSPPTTDHPYITSLLRALSPGGVSSLRDAVFAALVFRQLDRGRTLLIVFSSGWASFGYVRRPQLLDAARRTDAVAYAVTYRQDGISSRKYGPLLDAIAEETGGRVLIAREASGLTAAFVNILSEFRSRYVLAYVPTGVAPGGWHRLDVRLKNRGGEIKARRGYFAESK